LVDALDHAIVWEFDDTEQRYTFVSKHSLLVLGHDCTDWMADPGFFEGQVVAEDRPKLGEVLGKIRCGEANDMRLEHRCTKSDGTIVWVHTGIHRADEGGKVLLRGVTIDINNVKRAEERERAAKEEAQRTMLAYEEVMAIISHDLRTPLQSISLAATTLARDTRLSERLVPTIAGSATQMQRLIDDLTDLSQIRTRKLKVTPTEASTEEILRDVLERFAPIAEASAVRLTSALDEPIVLRCDPKRIAQVLANLVGNAIKFGGPTAQTVHVTVTTDELEARFSVFDQGPGIAPADLERVFEREWQAPETASQGSGLGLYIAKGIVLAHAGRIWVESILGRGAAFHFTVPRG